MEFADNNKYWMSKSVKGDGLEPFQVTVSVFMQRD
jgi:hypothetical protein